MFKKRDSKDDGVCLLEETGSHSQRMRCPIADFMLVMLNNDKFWAVVQERKVFWVPFPFKNSLNKT